MEESNSNINFTASAQTSVHSGQGSKLTEDLGSGNTGMSSSSITSGLLPSPTAPATTETVAKSSSALTLVPTPGSELKTTKTSKGRIVGGVVGGIFGLIVIGTLLFFYRRKRRNPPKLNLLRPRDTTGFPSPSLKDEWLTKVDAAMTEASRQTEIARSRAGSRAHAFDHEYSLYNGSGYQSPDTMTSKYQYGSQSRVLSPASPPIPDIYKHAEFLSHPEKTRDQDLDTESEASSVDLEAASRKGQWSYIPADSLVESMTTDGDEGHDSVEEGTSERERRRDELLEQMRRVLDNSDKTVMNGTTIASRFNNSVA
ncbi:hypothetical protein H0H87_002724 [Tephrocybe sp. NHM501043]|nr:hypothetical protein H0H87_002724 [Tephrocybe sp. NHM501043]